MASSTIFGTDFDLGENPHFVLIASSAGIIGAIAMSLRHWIKVHYSLPLFLFGLLVGHLTKISPGFADFSGLKIILEMDPLTSHQLFLPVLLFYFAFTMDPQTFKSATIKKISAGVLWFVLCVAMQGIFVLFAASFYQSTFPAADMTLTCATFGCITSITGHTIVIGILKKLGTCRSLILFLEAMRIISMIGVDVVIAFFTGVLQTPGWRFVVLFFIGNIFLAPLIGFVAVKITIWWILHVYNDTVLEVSISLAMCYVGLYSTLWIHEAEPYLSICSNSIIITYAVILNHHRDCFSEGVDSFFQSFIEVLQYMVEFVLFFIAGFVITVTQYETFDPPVMLFQLPLFLTFFCYSSFCKCLAALMIWPVTRRWNGLLSWQEMAVTGLCDFNSSFTLILTFDLMHPSRKSLFLGESGIQYMLIMYTNMFVVLKNTVGSLTANLMLTVLGLKHVSGAQQMSLSKCTEEIRGGINHMMSRCSTDRFLADADWDIVFQYINFEECINMFHQKSIFDSAASPEDNITYDEQTRLQLLLEFKRSYQRQYQNGMLSLNCKRMLLEQCDIAERAGRIEDMQFSESIRQYYEFKGTTSRFANRLIQKFRDFQRHRLDLIGELTLLYAKTPVKTAIFKFSFNPRLEIFSLLVMLLSVVGAIVVLVYESHCDKDWDPVTMFVLQDVLNLIYVGLMTSYLAVKFVIIKLRYLEFFGSYELVALCVIGWLDVVLNYAYLADSQPSDYCRRGDITAAQSAVHTICISLRMLRLFAVALDKTNFMYNVLIRRIQQNLRLGYELGKAYVTCKEDVYNSVFNGWLLDNVKLLLTESRARILRELGALQKHNSGIIRSIKSFNAGRRILYQIQETASQLRKDGLLDETEAQMLDKMIKLRIKKLRSIPVTFPAPPVAKILRQLKWVDNDERILEFIESQSSIVNMGEGESFEIDNNAFAGLFIVVTGLIEVELHTDEHIMPRSSLRHSLKSSAGAAPLMFPVQSASAMHDYLTTGATFGELSLLIGEPYPKKASCITTVVLCHIPYDSIRSSLDLFTEIPSLEYRLWQLCAARVALPMLKGLHAYQSTPLDELKMVAELGTLDVHQFTLPSGSEEDDGTQLYSLLPYSNNDVVLVYGTARNPDHNEIFTGPCLIPPRIDYLMFQPIDGDLFVLYFVPQVAHLIGNLAHATSASDFSQLSLSSSILLRRPTGSFSFPLRRSHGDHRASGYGESHPGTDASDTGRGSLQRPRRMSILRPSVLPSIPDDQTLVSDGGLTHSLRSSAMSSISAGGGSGASVEKSDRSLSATSPRPRVHGKMSAKEPPALKRTTFDTNIVIAKHSTSAQSLSSNSSHDRPTSTGFLMYSKANSPDRLTPVAVVRPVSNPPPVSSHNTASHGKVSRAVAPSHSTTTHSLSSDSSRDQPMPVGLLAHGLGQVDPPDGLTPVESTRPASQPLHSSGKSASRFQSLKKSTSHGKMSSSSPKNSDSNL